MKVAIIANGNSLNPSIGGSLKRAAAFLTQTFHPRIQKV